MGISRLSIKLALLLVIVGCSSNGKKPDGGLAGSFRADLGVETTETTDGRGAGGTAVVTTGLTTGGTAGTGSADVGTGGGTGTGGSDARDVGEPDAPGTEPDVPVGGGGGGLATGGNTGVGSGGRQGTGGRTGAGGTTTGAGMSTGGVATGGTSTVLTTGTGGMTGSAGTTGGAPSTGGVATGGKGGTLSTGGSSGAGSGGSPGTPAGIPGPSCADLAATCGPSGNESCCTSLLVPGGTFYRSYDGVGFTDKRYPATVSDFALDKYEATVGRFRAFVNAGMGTQAAAPAAGAGAHPSVSGSGWDSVWNANLPADTTALKTAVNCDSTLTLKFRTWTDTPGDNENRPINCLTWYEAFAFCAWDGGRLPTEAEWNYAAAGGSDQREYPWGSGIDPSRASYNSLQDSCTGDGVPGCTAADVAFVGSKPAGNGRWGHADLAGNLMEWTLDYFGSYPMPCADCANLVVDYCRAIRGGYFYYIPENSRAAVRFDDFLAEAVYSSDGVRCARSTR
jgi:formylglycine-generating enzyme required for sulfatase activity